MTDRRVDAHDDPMRRSEQGAPPIEGPQPGIVESATTVSSLGHDLNNVLTTVTTYADLLLISCEAGPEFHDALEIKKAALAGAELTRKLTLLSRSLAHEAPVDEPPAAEPPARRGSVL